MVFQHHDNTVTESPGEASCERPTPAVRPNAWQVGSEESLQCPVRTMQVWCHRSVRRQDIPKQAVSLGVGRVFCGAQMMELGSAGSPPARMRLACTRMRFMQMQVCPAFRKAEARAPAAALCRSASSNTIRGAFPPSSRDT